MTEMMGSVPPILATLSKRLDRIERELNHVRSLSSSLAPGGAFGSNTILATFSKASIPDNSATSIFTVTTTNAVFSNDGGGFTCRVYALIGHAIAATATNLAIEYNDCVFQRINKNDGTDYGVLGEILEGASTASDSGTRDIGAVTPSITLTSNYVTTFNLQIDLTGTDVTTAEASLFVVLIWYGYGTAPTLAAA